ncbi:AraC family transcriptional regulator [Bacillus pakistanensis]|uniref:AraC family transcriptional regulator n=1 Tax=Rossellomorea pakistanensis TaxID=992288 RepID=A0ABS2N6K0_9BACI|nr:effector binding domain-containing protein [Bacillus pakistanensis]MBM7583490.1 AraC family transcriptional regulator [Bacillus pakistanensis]
MKGIGKVDYYERMQQAIEFIEKNLQKELTITDIASKTYFSSFHFQRLFQAITGFSVQKYIRQRRLSEAAIKMKESSQSILEIAISFQYGSQEAFSRAFINYFNIAPGKFRRKDVQLGIQAKLNLLDFKEKMKGELTINKPKIISLNKIHIIGHEYKTNLNNEKYFEEIPGFYDHFGRNEYYLKIPSKIAPNFAYGISCNFHDDGNFSFIVGEEVRNEANELESGFINFEIPEGKYAEFTIDGPSELVQNTRRYIYGTWLLNSNYERNAGPDFEVTDVCNSIFPNRMRVKIYIPIK